MITTTQAQNIMQILTHGGALTEVDLWELIDFLIAMCPERPNMVRLGTSSSASPPDTA